ncbi:hypothetical protein CWE17_00015 [Synechococcus sp. BS56D]|uniref:hypothetical protein n=1 Tax=Synechococcus sp. BS56D TaxID=2055944 RepID=UPI00103965C0|nr:hypothetical protein [Synechococcus sp. BS56D]TCD59238.1 hypothetical protein CWE17_00015 [Synechococcus sp. BS56D]
MITSALPWVLGAAVMVAGSGRQPFFPAELKPLLAALQRAGYVVTLEAPSARGAYGLTDTRQRRIWIAPLSIDMGIVRATLIHEAVHAAQSCPDGRPKTIGWVWQQQPMVEKEINGLLYRGYPRDRFAIEREAFRMQSHPRAIELVTAALDQRCRSKPKR